MHSDLDVVDAVGAPTSWCPRTDSNLTCGSISDLAQYAIYLKPTFGGTGRPNDRRIANQFNVAARITPLSAHRGFITPCTLQRCNRIFNREYDSARPATEASYHWGLTAYV